MYTLKAGLKWYIYHSFMATGKLQLFFFVLSIFLKQVEFSILRKVTYLLGIPHETTAHLINCF
jgi:hypothetical protein